MIVRRRIDDDDYDYDDNDDANDDDRRSESARESAQWKQTMRFLKIL